MIVKSGGLSASTNGAKWTVLQIKPVEDPYKEDSVWRIGMFWDIKIARIFAERYRSICAFCNKEHHSDNIILICDGCSESMP
jgi:hypothetical protein